ncbi:hypothetical protein SNEBB_000739 [Seison nebaliae]|nr:hypothetical protein SNEBB_000739 [Seison nebaliae]
MDNNYTVNPEINYNPHLTKQNFIQSIILFCIFAVSFIANSTVVVLISTKSCRKNSHQICKNNAIRIFVRQLAISDLAVTTFGILGEAIWKLTVMFYGSNFLCKWLKTMQIFAFYLSIISTILISADRYVAVQHPLSLHNWHQHLTSVISFGWFLSLLLSLPQCFIFKLATPSVSSHFWQCVSFFFLEQSFLNGEILKNNLTNVDEAIKEKHSIFIRLKDVQLHDFCYRIYALLSLFIIPLLIIAYFYWRISKCLFDRRHHSYVSNFSHKRPKSSNKHSDKNQHSQISIQNNGSVSSFSRGVHRISTTSFIDTLKYKKSQSITTVDSRNIPGDLMEFDCPSTSRWKYSTNSSRTTRKSDLRRKSTGKCYGNRGTSKALKKSLLLSISIVLLFILFHAPYYIRMLIHMTFSNQTESKTQKLFAEYIFFSVLINSALNPVIYGVFSSRIC